MTALIELETEDFAQASRSLRSDVADPLTTAVQRLVTCLQGCAAMAGNDPGGRDWAAAYDQATASTLAASQDAVNACFRLSALFAQTARNYELADAASTAGVRQAIAAATTRLPGDYWFCVATRMPSAAGGSGGGPPGWGLIAGLVGFVWPDGHQDRLRTAAQAWRSSADSLWAHSDYVAFAAVPAIVDHLPESNDMSTVCTAMYSHLREVAHAQYALADACDELAHHLDEVHSAVEGELAGLVEWTAGIEFAGTLLSVVTLGAAEAPTQAVEGARIARTAARVAGLIDKFVALARASAEAISAVVERAGAAAARLRAILDMKVTEATVALAGRVRIIRADGELGALGRLGDEASSFPRVTMAWTQIEKKFRHAADFGVSASRGREGFTAFRAAVGRFLENPETVRKVGTYRGQRVILSYSDTSHLVVVQQTSGEFVSGWRMTPLQYRYLVERGSLGGE